MTDKPGVTLADVRAAAAAIDGAANRTPVITSRTLDRMAGCSVFLKCESFQRTGSFKFRGAYNAIAKLTEVERSRGLLTYSSGNHAQALALAARLHGARLTVVMPQSAPRVKREATAGYGAEIVTYDETMQVREEVARQIEEESGRVLIPPFDHPSVIAGQGTAALELIEEVDGLGAIYVPCGGGGLLSGSALAARSLTNCSVIGVEPETADDATRTFRTGTVQTVRNPPTIADGLRTPSLGRWTWPVIRDSVTDMMTVTEVEIVAAMQLLWTRLKLVVEPSGAVGLAGLLKAGAKNDERVGVILSGGNADVKEVSRLFG